VLGIYPWGVKGTALENETGPDDWQAEYLNDIGRELFRVDSGESNLSTAQFAVGSGHGTGKSTVFSWLVNFWCSTRPKPIGRVTAGTEAQLRQTLWREVAKWHGLAANRHWFEVTATQFRMISNPVEWTISAIPWSESNPQAFAGIHDANVMFLFDEASTIADIIIETSEGAFTTPGGLWCLHGNRTEAGGRFNACFGRERRYWNTRIIDSRKAKKADKKKLAQWAEQYGEDSDFFRVRVMGEAPRGSDTRIITADMLEAAVLRKIDEDWLHIDIPFILGIDPAGGGVSKTTLIGRKGPVTKKDWIIDFSEHNQMRVASMIAEHLSRLRPDYAFIDAHGIGKPIYDRLNQLGYFNVLPVYGGDRSAVVEKLRYYNPRAEWWGRMAEWLKVSSIPDDKELRDQLLAQPMEQRQMRLQLMDKQQMRELGIQSPDKGDALSLTFAELVTAKRGSSSIAHEDALPEHV
jgi:hypothetical protein